MAAGDIYRVTVGCWAINQSGINVLHYRTASETGVGVTQTEIGTEIDPVFAARYKALLASDAVYYGVKVGRVFPSTPLLPVVVHANTGAGTFGAAIMPGAVCGMITKQTAYAGQAYRGRSYIPFPAESANDDDTMLPTAGYMTALALLADVLDDTRAITGAGGTASLEPILYDPDDQSWVSLAACLARQKWGIQRRRGSYGQQNAYPPL